MLNRHPRGIGHNAGLLSPLTCERCGLSQLVPWMPHFLSDLHCRHGSVSTFDIRLMTCLSSPSMCIPGTYIPECLNIHAFTSIYKDCCHNSVMACMPLLCHVPSRKTAHSTISISEDGWTVSLKSEAALCMLLTAIDLLGVWTFGNKLL